MAVDDGNDDASPTATGCVLLFCLSEVDVRLLIEEPRATAVKNKTKQKKKNSSAVETFVARFLKCIFFPFNIWVTCTQIKVAGFCGMKLYS